MGQQLKIYAIIAAGLLSANTAQAALVAATATSGGVYDTVANVTWSQDANLFATMAATNATLVGDIIAASPTVATTPDAANPTGTYTLTAADFTASGPGAGSMTWYGALGWAKYLNSISYLGHNTWIVPTTYDQTCINGPCTNSMLGELYYIGLGLTTGQSITSSPNSALFTNLLDRSYWSSTEVLANTSWAFAFGNPPGWQYGDTKSMQSYAWVAFTPIPEPASLPLLLTGLGILGYATRRRATIEPTA